MGGMIGAAELSLGFWKVEDEDLSLTSEVFWLPYVTECHDAAPPVAHLRSGVVWLR